MTGGSEAPAGLRVGLVGLGYWGPNYARLLSGQVDGVRLVACADLREERLAAVRVGYPGVRCFTDHNRLLAGAAVDAVVVATGAAAHRQVVLDCLAAGAHVLVEKPLARTTADAAEMVAAAQRRGRVLMVGHTFVFNPAVRQIKRWLDAGELGRLRYLSFRRTGLGPVRRDVNALWDLAPHDLSMLRYWLDADPVEVTARGQGYLRPDMEDVVFLTLRFPGEVLAGIQVSWLDPVKDRRVTIVGDRRMVLFDDVQPVEKLRRYDTGLSYQPDGGEFADFLTSVRDGDILIPRIDRGEPLREQVQHFTDCIRTGRRPRSDGADGLAVVRILEQAQAELAAPSPAAVPV